jgi:hypothetical protein
MKRIQAFFTKENVILSTYVLASIIIAIQHTVGHPDKHNNFTIFRRALFHLLDGKNLHLPYPQEYFDIFLYHPSFCILFAPFSLLPLIPSLILWLIGCSVLMFYAIRLLPITQSQKVFAWWFILIELTTSLHNQQTNPIIAALGVLTFVFLEKGKVKWAALFPILAFCIKGYGIIFAALFLFYPEQRRYLSFSVLWALILALLPLPLVGWGHFIQVYKDWADCLVQDHKINYGFSIMGWIKAIWPSYSAVIQVQYVGVGLFAITWLKNWIWPINSFLQRFLLMGYACLWVIMFNHAAESSTYIIALPGVVIFYLINRDAWSPWATVLIVLVFFFSILAPTDVYPRAWRQNFFLPYLVKVVPCFIVWCSIQIQLLVSNDAKSNLR